MNWFKKPKAIVSYYLCGEHSKDALKNGNLLMLFLVAIFVLMSRFPIDLVSLPLIVVGYFVFKVIGKTTDRIVLKKQEDGKLWVTGFSPEFLEKITEK